MIKGDPKKRPRRQKMYNQNSGFFKKLFLAVV